MKHPAPPLSAVSAPRGHFLFYPPPQTRRRVLGAIARIIGIFCLFISFALLLKPLIRQQAAAVAAPALPPAYALYAGAVLLGAALAALALSVIMLRRRLAALKGGHSAAPASAAAADTRTEQTMAAAPLLDAVPLPVWLRDKNGAIRYANQAYRRIVALPATGKHDTNTKAGALPDIENLFSPALQKDLLEARQNRRDFHGRSNIVLQGNRHIFVCRSLYDAQSEGFLGLAEDITENLHLQGEMERLKQGYAETLDRLSTSVAIFNPEMKLQFFNAAFAALWPLETQFLEKQPSHAVLLDRLREKGILNERPDWRQWQDDLFEAYRALTPQHYTWNLPDGRTLRVVANPHPQGGVTWLFDDLSEKLALEARYNTLIRMQGESLDNLSEGVAVFGADGLLRLANPAFAKLWHLPPKLAIEGTHIENIKQFCQPTAKAAPAAAGQSRAEAEAVWQTIALYITGFADRRDFARGRTDLADKRVVDYSLAPLPQGQTLLTFADVTDSVNIARALHERNAALESADRLRNDFVQHVSYELRTPLTNIMGFTDLLRSPAFGALNARQSGYLDNIAGQSVLLLNLVNDILDLATVDAGIMELNIGSVSVAVAMRYAADRLEQRLKAKNITLERHIAAGLSVFEADEARVRQIFVNLLSNAVHAAPVNSRIRFCAEKYGNAIAFSVEDEGAGIAPERQHKIFRRFTSYDKSGAGLGLSIVKSFVELHQGHIAVETGRNNQGTKLICRFPFHDIAANSQKPPADSSAAEHYAESESGETEAR